MNNSLVIQTLLNGTFIRNSKTSENTNDLSEFVYIIVVILFYSSGALCLLISRVKPRSDIVSLNDMRAAENLINRMKEQIHTKTLLQQLQDKEYRARVWSIYRKDSNGCVSREPDFYAKNEENILKNLAKKIKIIKQREDASFELRHIGIHNRSQSSQLDKDRINNLIKEWSKKLVDKPKTDDDSRPDYYFTIAGSTFQTNTQERQLLMNAFKQRQASDEIKISKSLDNLNQIRFKISKVSTNDKSNSNNKVTFNSNITNFQ